MCGLEGWGWGAGRGSPCFRGYVAERMTGHPVDPGMSSSSLYRGCDFTHIKQILMNDICKRE